MKQSIIKVAALAAHVAGGPGRRVLHCGKDAMRVAAKPGIYVVRRGVCAADYAIGTALTVATAMVAMLPAAPVGAAMAIVAAVVALLPSMRANAALTATKISQITREGSKLSGHVAVELSGITYAGGNLFYTVDDSTYTTNMYPMTIEINKSNGSLTSAKVGTPVYMKNAYDMEGCAFDPLTGNLWIAEESGGPTIREYDLTTGERLRSVAIPSIFSKKRGNYSFEALTISGDGLTMWTGNEEALTVDGELTSTTNGTLVRLQKFTRSSGQDNWSAAGQWAYEVTSKLSASFSSSCRSGVSAMAALPDGTLLVLERKLQGSSSLSSYFYNGIYAVDFSNATDTSGIASLKETSFTPVRKIEVYKYSSEGTWNNSSQKWNNNGSYNWEGMCLGPRLDDGSVTLVLVSDGGAGENLAIGQGVATLRLDGIDVVSLTMSSPNDVGTMSPGRGPLRYIAGTNLTASIAGLDYPSAYTNNAASITNVYSILDMSNVAFGDETQIVLTGDHELRWLVNTHTENSSIDNGDSFETYAAGANAAGGEVGAWTGDGEVMLCEYTPPDPPGYAMPKDAHTKVLDIDGSVARDFSCTTNGNDRLDLMLRVTRRNADSPTPDIPADAKVALQCGEDGVLQLYCRDSEGVAGWLPLDDGRTFEQNEWIRVSVHLDCTTSPGSEYVLVRVNGKSFETAGGAHLPGAPATGGAWFRTAGGNPDGRIAALSMNGTTKLDDVIKTTEEFSAELSATTADIDGVPLAWLAANGNGDDPQSPATTSRRRAIGYSLADIYDSGIDPDGDDPFQITDIRILDDGRLELTLNGLREDLTDSQRDALYPIYRRETVGGEESPVAGTTAISGGQTIWTSSEPVNLEQGFYRAKVQPQR